MYNITLYESGHFCTHIGGPVMTLPQAIDQLRAVAATLQAEELPDYLGYKFDRAGTPCALIVTDRWKMPITNVQNEED